MRGFMIFRNEEDKGGTPPAESSQESKVDVPAPQETESKPFLVFKTAEDADNYNKALVEKARKEGYQARENEYQEQLKKAEAEKIKQQKNTLIEEIKGDEKLVELLNNGAEGWEDADIKVIESYKNMFAAKKEEFKKKNSSPAPSGVVLDRNGKYDVEANMKRLMKEAGK